MKTQQEVLAWLKESRPRVILVEVSVLDAQGVSLPAPLYLSNYSYTASGTVTYMPLIQSGISFNESVSLDGTPSISYGDIELINMDGSLDAWLDYVWVNRPISIYIGDASWNRSDFYQIFEGTTVDLISRNYTALNIVLASKLQRLNMPITTQELTNSTTNDKKLVPLVLGECFNIAPITTDVIPNTLQYLVSAYNTHGIIEVRDAGAPADIVENGSTFELVYNPYGQITASVQGYAGSSGYKDTAADLVASIITSSELGGASSGVSIDSTNFSNIESVASRKVGVLCTDRENILDTCNNLLVGISAQLFTTPLGQAKIVRVVAPSKVLAEGVSNNHVITDSDIILDTISISERLQVKGAVKVAYCKNWTVQSSGLVAGLPSASITLFKDEWLYASAVDQAKVNIYSIEEEPQVLETLLIRGQDAQDLANEQLELWSTPRLIYTMDCYENMMFVEVGDTVTVTHKRLGLHSGKLGLVLNTNKDWLNNKITIGVLV